jgi:hypothetical protein
MALAEDVARWAWYKGRFEEIFGDRTAGRFHQGVWIATANEVASLA